MATTKADFSQTDSRWSGELLGFAKKQTIKYYGCYIVGLANIAQAQGKDVTPSDINRMLKEHDQFSVDADKEKSDVKSPSSMSVIFPDIVNIENKNWGKALADINFFDIRHNATDDVLVMIDYHPERSGVQTHFCRVIGVNDARNDIEIVDSYTGKRIWVSSLGKPANKLIYKAYKYRGPGTGVNTSASSTAAAQSTNTVNIRINTGMWNVRTSPSLGDNIVPAKNDNPNKVLGGQQYAAEIVGSWAKISFNGMTVYIGPKAFAIV